MTDRPEEFRFDSGLATVVRVYQSAWECDLEAEDGGLIRRALVEGPRLPEVSTPERPQWVVYSHSSHLQGRAVCRPVESRLTGPRLQRLPFLRYEEAQRFRQTIVASIDEPKTPAEWEIRNSSKDGLLQIRLQEQDGVIRIDTNRTRIVLTNKDGSIAVHCDGNLTATVDGNATVTVKGDLTATARNIDAEADGNATVKATGNLALKGAIVNIEGVVTITGPLTVTGLTTLPTVQVGIGGNTAQPFHLP